MYAVTFKKTRKNVYRFSFTITKYLNVSRGLTVGVPEEISDRFGI